MGHQETLRSHSIFATKQAGYDGIVAEQIKTQTVAERVAQIHLFRQNYQKALTTLETLPPTTIFSFDTSYKEEKSTKLIVIHKILEDGRISIKSIDGGYSNNVNLINFFLSTDLARLDKDTRELMINQEAVDNYKNQNSSKNE